MTFQFKMLCTIIKNKFLIFLNKVNITKQWMWLYASPVSAKGFIELKWESFFN